MRKLIVTGSSGILGRRLIELFVITQTSSDTLHFPTVKILTI